jgi:hypothetical protein
VMIRSNWKWLPHHNAIKLLVACAIKVGCIV